MYFNEKTVLFWDHQFVPAAEAKENLYLQTLHYGFGVFEGIRSYQTTDGPRIFKGKEHYERLQHSCELLKIPFDHSIDFLIEKSYELLRLNEFGDAYIRPLIYCDPNMSLYVNSKPHLVLQAWQWGAYLGEKLLRIKISPYCRPHPQSVHIEAKANGHYVNSILATTDAKSEGFDEALLLDVEGNLAEGPGANLFFEMNGVLYTPQAGHILKGITRATVLELCEALKIQVVEGAFTKEHLLHADSAFFCGTGAEIIGIGSVNDIEFRKPWNETLGARIQKAYSQLVRAQPFTHHV